MKLRKSIILGLTIFLAILSSCEKDKIPPAKDQIADKNFNKNNEQMTVLGEKLENPYTVTNMERAYNNLKSSNTGVSDIDIETTHYYIRFLPKK
ncbi:MAG: hypothetical protein ACOCW8_01505 [bacterium]